MADRRLRIRNPFASLITLTLLSLSTGLARKENEQTRREAERSRPKEIERLLITCPILFAPPLGKLS